MCGCMIIEKETEKNRRESTGTLAISLGEY
jgi:hypothetical protein